VRFAAPASALTVAIAMTAPASVAIKLKTDRQPPPETPVRIVAGAGMVTFTVTNQRRGVSVSTSTAAKTMVVGEATTSASSLNALIAAFTPSTTVEIAAHNNIIEVSSTNSCYRLPTLPEAPTAFAITGESGGAEISRADCLRLLEVLPAVETEQTRFYLCGVFLQTVEDELVAVATNGVQLLRVSAAADYLSDDERLIIPTPAAIMMRRLLRQAKADSVTLRRSRGMFSIAAPGSFELVTSLVDGTYPDYRKVLPRAASNSAVCQRVELLGALARLKAVAGGLVLLSWNDGDAELLVTLPQRPGAGVDTLAAHTTGRANMVFDLAQLAAVVAEFDDDAVHVDVADRALLIHQGSKTGVLASCNWHEVTAT
jgi:DNA polymerase III subunit beta